MSAARNPAPLGEFETLIILAILQVSERESEAYGSVIRDDIQRRTGRDVPRGSIYVTLDRLEGKGLLASREGGASAARGGRAKRLFRVTPAGLRAVKASVGAVIHMHRGLESLLGRS